MAESNARGTPEEADRQRLVDQYTEIAQLAGGLAHEIKNPLSTIRLTMELLAEDFADAETPRERRALTKIRTVDRECQRLQDLLDDFLNFAKSRQLRTERCDVNRELEQVLDFFAPEAEGAKVEVVRYLDPDVAHVELDRERFHAAVLNLLLNAEQAMPEGGQLVVRTAEHGADAIEIVLIDTGVGMNEETLAHIFDAFYSTKASGSGLGLATTRKIIEAHGGTVEVASEPGRGTQFTLTLPAAT